jgi:hypothetical protein
MIASHQPHIFGSAVRSALSSRIDGDMKFGIRPNDEIVHNREAFLDEAGIAIGEAIFVQLSYDKEDFTVYKEASYEQIGDGMRDKGGMVADALVTTLPGIALFLPIADCVGAILYDANKKILMVSHLGRHSIEQSGAIKCVKFLERNYNSRPEAIKVWLSPAAGKAEYPLYAFNHRSMHDVIHEQLIEIGVAIDHIETSSVDSARSEEYYSHSQFLKGTRTEDGRFAIVAMMLEQGEPAKE